MKFADLKAFYDARGGERSPERDFGSWWTMGAALAAAAAGPFRVTWVESTGDIYKLHLRPLAGIDAIELLAAGTPATRGIGGYPKVATIFEGYVDEMWKPDSLRWVRERLAAVVDAVSETFKDIDGTGSAESGSRRKRH